ncbi:MAG TPA: D-aminoacyl-tRNA deacylase [Salinivirgaceae bacterium]|nr:D-aminoacyl-tRNA deacylase [Salinivirgaceae bacterium]HQA75561.1 D-aminoacyl-tRNA deacylase [Salinivirgaceae bacterium]
MRAIIQRCLSASVTVENQVVGKIDKGFLVLLGIEHSDTLEDAEWLSSKIAQLRVFDDKVGLMNLSIQENDGNILSISQFTLHAKTKKGNRPSFINAAPPEISKPLYEKFNELLSQKIGKPVETGIFGAHMLISLVNDGPVTIFIDTKNRE